MTKIEALQGQEETETRRDAADVTDVMTVDEGADFLRISRNQLYDAIGRGEVPHRRIGKIIRLSRQGLVRWLTEPCTLAVPKGHP